MAVDSKEKRLSIINLGLPWWTTLPEADGAIDADDRLHLLNLYSGISATIHTAEPFGLEYTIPANRCHCEVPDMRLHYAIPANRLHYAMPEED